MKRLKLAVMFWKPLSTLNMTDEDAQIPAEQLQKLLNVFTFELNHQTYLAHAALKDIFTPLAESGCFQAKNNKKSPHVASFQEGVPPLRP